MEEPPLNLLGSLMDSHGNLTRQNFLMRFWSIIGEFTLERRTQSAYHSASKAGAWLGIE